MKGTASFYGFVLVFFLGVLLGNTIPDSSINAWIPFAVWSGVIVLVLLLMGFYALGKKAGK